MIPCVLYAPEPIPAISVGICWDADPTAAALEDSCHKFCTGMDHESMAGEFLDVFNYPTLGVKNSEINPDNSKAPQ